MGAVSMDLWELCQLQDEVVKLRQENAELKLEIGRLLESKKVWSDFELKLP
jgi:hypothetical protein